MSPLDFPAALAFSIIGGIGLLICAVVYLIHCHERHQARKARATRRAEAVATSRPATNHLACRNGAPCADCLHVDQILAELEKEFHGGAL